MIQKYWATNGEKKSILSEVMEFYLRPDIIAVVWKQIKLFVKALMSIKKRKYHANQGAAENLEV